MIANGKRQGHTTTFIHVMMAAKQQVYAMISDHILYATYMYCDR